MLLHYVGRPQFAQWLETSITEHQKETGGVAPALVPLATDENQMQPFCVLCEGPVQVDARVVVRVCEPGSRGSLDDASSATQWTLVRGIDDKVQFRQLMEFLSLRSESERISELISGPVAHDLRGALGVVGLSAQLLQVSDRQLAAKLNAARLKAEALLADMQTISSPGVLSSRHSQHRQLMDVDSALSGWSQIISDVQTWFSAAHRERQLIVSEPTVHGPAPRLADTVLRGMVDTLARLSARDMPIRLLPQQGSVVAAVEASRVTEEQRRILQAVGSFDPASTPMSALPFRFVLALAAAAREKTSLSVRLNGTGLELSYALTV